MGVDDILTVCLDCGRQRDTKHKRYFGVWTDTCDICGRQNTACASAPHDFGIYSSKKLKEDDEVQDLI
jgi:hypothetical protein